jgi:hypothetical protein
MTDKSRRSGAGSSGGPDGPDGSDKPRGRDRHHARGPADGHDAPADEPTKRQAPRAQGLDPPPAEPYDRRRTDDVPIAGERASPTPPPTTETSSSGSTAAPQEPPMSYDYTKSFFDPRGLPDSLSTLAAQKIYQTRVETELDKTFGLPKQGNEALYGFVIGNLLLGEHFDSTATDFVDAIDDARKITLGKQAKPVVQQPDGSLAGTPNKQYIAQVAELILTVPGHGQAVSFQELASVSAFALERADEVPLDDPNFGTQVRVGLDRYVAGDPLALPIDLDGFASAETSDEIVTENVKAFAKVFRGYYMERLRLVDVVDRIVELWHNGLLPIGNDAAGRALDTYAFNAEDFMSPAARQMTYARMLGSPGGDVSKEVQPNREFEQLFMRFLGSLAEYDRQRRIGDIFGASRTALSLTAEQVRKAGRDLGANVSLYGWGGAHFSAKRIEGQLGAAIAILKQPAVQRAYGVTTPLQVIERVTQREFGAVPNIVKFRTMAESGKEILDVVARNARAWTSNGNLPLFPETFPGTGVGVLSAASSSQSDISLQDQTTLLRHTQFILAVQGVAQDQVDRLSQPVDSVYAPSVPSLDSMVAMPASNGDGASGTIDRIRQMVASGTPPTIDQLQQLLPAGR